MPYILKEKRQHIEPGILSLSRLLETKGDYNYAITRLLHTWIEKHGKRYEHVNDAQGIIDCVGKEFYRVVTAPYENKKRKENGPVSSIDKDFGNTE